MKFMTLLSLWSKKTLKKSKSKYIRDAFVQTERPAKQCVDKQVGNSKRMVTVGTQYRTSHFSEKNDGPTEPSIVPLKVKITKPRKYKDVGVNTDNTFLKHQFDI